MELSFDDDEERGRETRSFEGNEVEILRRFAA